MKRLKPPNKYAAILLVALFLFFSLNDAAYAGSRTQVTVSIAFGTVIAGAIGLTIYISTTRVSLMEGITNFTLLDVQKRALLNLEDNKFTFQIPSIIVDTEEPSPSAVDRSHPIYKASILEIKF